MLLYLSKYGPQEEKRVHPLIQSRSKKHLHNLPDELTIHKNIRQTFSKMQTGVNVLNHSWIGSDNYVAKTEQLVKVSKESSFDSFAYVPLFYRKNLRLKKYFVMEGVFLTLICSEMQGTEIDYFLVKTKDEQLQIDVEDQLDVLEQDLLLISNIVNKITIPTPNYTRDCKICEWKQYCKNLAKVTGDLTLISGIGKRIKSELKKLNINSVSELASANLENTNLEFTSKKHLEYIQLQARSFVNDEKIIRESIQFPEKTTELYVDIEGSPYQDFVWMIGCLVKEKGNVEHKNFLAKSPKEEQSMFESFLEFLKEYDNNYILYHWSQAEPQYFRNLTKKHTIPFSNLKTILDNSLDLFKIFKKKIILPISSYTLKEVANYIGFQWDEPLSDGATSIVLFDKWYNYGDQKALRRAILYNSDDCKALMIIKKFIIKLQNPIKGE